MVTQMRLSDVAIMNAKPEHMYRLLSRSIHDPVSGCVQFQGYRDKDGYATVTVNGRSIRAIRMVLWFKTQKLEQVARHTCDNPCCVNREHLVWGEPKNNSEDMVSRDRHSNGNREKKVCKRGHSLTLLRTGKRTCRTCNKERERTRRKNARTVS